MHINAPGHFGTKASNICCIASAEVYIDASSNEGLHLAIEPKPALIDKGTEIVGGFGQKIASYLGGKNVRVLNYGFIKKFYDGMSAKDALEESRITPDCIAQDIEALS